MSSGHNISGQKGFTLLELVVVVAVLALLILAVASVLKPGEVIRDARDARRYMDVHQISMSLYRYIITNGVIPVEITAKEKQIGTAKVGCDTACPGADKSCVALGFLFPDYMSRYANDPLGGTDATTFYSVRRTEGNAIAVKACKPESHPSIQVIR